MSPRAAVLLATYALVASAWNYDRCDPINGPAGGWNTIGQCAGLEQTPINLCGAVPFAAPPALTAFNYNLPGQMIVKNKGHTFEVQAAGTTPFVQIPGLHQLVGRATPSSTPIVDWTFQQMHVHFGREGNPNEGSEHTMDGRRFPVEIHLVHFNPARGANVSAAVASGAKDALLVVGVFLDLAEVESPFVTAISSMAPTLRPPPTNIAITAQGALQLADIFDPLDAFYSYGGSLTTPGCNEQVTWVVMKTPKTITPDSLDLLKLTKETVNETIAFTGNYRRIQPLNNRTLYSSRPIAGACQLTPVTEPCYVCAAAAPTPGLVFFDVGTDQAKESVPCEKQTSTSPWVWVAAGAAVPTAIMVIAGAIMYYTSWRRTNPTEKIGMAYSPFERRMDMIPTTEAHEWQSK